MAARVDFHLHVGQPFDYGCRLVRKAWLAGHRVLVNLPAAQRDAFDQLLWTFAPHEFVPHCASTDPLAAQTPVVLVAAGDDAVGCDDILVNFDDQLPVMAQRFARVIEIVGRDDASVAAARIRFKQYRDAGCDVTHHDMSAAG